MWPRFVRMPPGPGLWRSSVPELGSLKHGGTQEGIKSGFVEFKVILIRSDGESR